MSKFRSKILIFHRKFCVLFKIKYLGGAAQMVIINLFNRLEVNESFQLGFVLV